MKYVILIGDFGDGIPHHFSTGETIREIHNRMKTAGYRLRYRRVGEAAYYENPKLMKWARVLRTSDIPSSEEA